VSHNSGDRFHPSCPACGDEFPELEFDGGPHTGRPLNRQMRCANKLCSHRGPVEVWDEERKDFRRAR
jgi:hypothetical protein